MSENIGSQPEVMTAEQSFQCIMLARQILKLRISPDGYGIMETNRAIKRKTDKKPEEPLESIEVDAFHAWPKATFMELGVSATPRVPGEWVDYKFTEHGLSETAYMRGELLQDPASAEISYWNADDKEIPASENNPQIVYYYLGGEQEPAKKVGLRGPGKKTTEIEGLRPSPKEGTLVIADLMNVLAIAQEHDPVA